MSNEAKSYEEIIKELDKLKQQNAELLQIFDSMVDGVRIIDKDKNVIRVNKKLAMMSGISKQDVIGKKCYETCNSGFCNTSKCPLERILAGEEYIECEIDNLYCGNYTITCNLTVQPYRDSAGKLLGIIETFKDITQHKKVEKAYSKRDELYQMIFENAPFGILYFDTSGKNIAFNSKTVKIMGTSKERFSDFNMLTDLEDKDMIYALESALSGKTGYYEGVYRSVTGNKLTPLRATFNPLITENGDFIGVVTIFEDITARKLTEEALYESERQHDIILSGISDFVALLKVEDDNKLKVLKMSSSLLKKSHLKKEKVVGNLLQNIAPMGIHVNMIKYLQKATETSRPVKYEEIYKDSAYEVKLIPIFDFNGKCTYIILVAHDITEKKMMEEHFLRAEKLESVGILAGGIAHDFNNILTVIGGNVSLAKLKLGLNEAEEESSLINLLTEAEKASIQAKGLTQQLLTFAKGGAPVIKTASIKELLKETVTFALRGSKAKCEFILSNDLWPVQIDEGQINQVIQNLIINADQAMPYGGIIEISAKNIYIKQKLSLPLNEGEYVKISIKDQGVGIPKVHLDKLFDPYFTTKQRGSGLGLATSYSIIHKHGGYITVESELGSGSVFHIYLPASSKEVVEANSPEIPLEGKGRVLLMDDDKMVRLVVSEMLNHIGYEVACAKDGSESIEMYEEAQDGKNPFDVVIMDLTIPGGMGGKEAIHKLREIDDNIKAIVSSGYSNDPVMADYQKYGFEAVIGKPYSIEELSEVLQSLLK